MLVDEIMNYMSEKCRKTYNLETAILKEKTIANNKIKFKFQEMIKGKEKPYKIGFYFIRDSRRAFDYINALQLPLDLMQDFAWIDDDNMENVIPIILGYEVDKENTGVRIEVL